MLTDERVRQIVGAHHDRLMARQGATRRWAKMPQAQRNEWVEECKALVRELWAAKRAAAREQEQQASQEAA